MIGALFFCSIAVFFAWLESSGRNKYGLKISWISIFIFSALRYDFGNDYWSYPEFFKMVKSTSISSLDLGLIKGNEFGWLYLNYLFSNVGFFVMIAFLAAFNCIIVYNFIKKYVPVKYYWFAVFIYTFQPYNMIVLLSAMRQAVAVSLFLLAIDYLIRKKVAAYILLIFVATTFHTSAFLLFPLIFIPFFNIRIRFIYILLTLVLFFLLVAFNDKVFQTINLITILYFNIYTGSLKDNLMLSEIGVGFILNLLLNLVVIYYSKNEINRQHNILFILSITSILLIPMSLEVILVSRVNFYLTPIFMATLPFVFDKLKIKEIRLSYILIIVMQTLYQFFHFFQSATWSKSFGVYKTIFSSPTWY